MAAYSYSRTLFLTENGSPMVFSMVPCKEKKRLRPLIDRGGGIITSSNRDGFIRLAEEGSAVSENNVISSKFITDCIRQNTLLSMEKYRLAPGRQADLSPSSSIVQVKGSKVKGRQKYSVSEDMRIFSYIMSENKHSEVRGKAIWRDMELIKLTSHSAESMRTHFLKHMIPKLDSYPIKDSWKVKLSYLAPPTKTFTAGTEPGRGESSSEEDIQEMDEFDADLMKQAEKTSGARNHHAKLQVKMSWLHGRGPSQTKAAASSRRNSSSSDDTHVMDGDTEDMSGVSSTRFSQAERHQALKQRTRARRDLDPSPGPSSSCHSPKIPSLQPWGASPHRARGKLDPPPAPSNKHRPPQAPSLRLQGALPHRVGAWQEQEEEEDLIEDVSSPASFLTALDVPQTSSSREPHTGLVNGTSTDQAATSGNGTDIWFTVVSMCQDFRLSPREALQCLWVNSGCVEDAYHYLKHGRRQNGHTAWSSQEDEILQGTDQNKIDELIHRFGEQNVSKRLIFLGI